MIPLRIRLIALVGFVCVFLVGYGFFGYTHHYTTLYATTPLDFAIPFVPAFIVFYLAGDVFVFILFFLFDEMKKFTRMVEGLLVILLIAFLCFWLVPIELQRYLIYDQGFLGLLTRYQHRFDTTYNTFPSLHVAFSTYTWLILWKEQKKIAHYTAPLLLLIIASVLFVKEHLIIDVLGGFILGTGVFYWWSKSLDNQQERGSGKRLRKTRA